MQQRTIESDYRQTIRRHIVPFGAMTQEKYAQTFAVGWHPEPLTFSQIMEAIKDNIIKDLVYFRKVARKYVPDLIQQGWLRLWQALHDDSNFLAERTRLSTADYVSNRCGASTHHYYRKRYTSYHQFTNWHLPDSEVFEDSITDIVIGSSLKSTGRGRHALFASKLDIHLDIARAIRTVVAWCGDNLKKLAALYYITTSVSQVDAGRIAGLPIKECKGRKPRCVAMQYWTRQVLEQLQTAFASYRPLEPNKNYWHQCLKTGYIEPVIELAKKYGDEPKKLLALYSLTTQVSTATIVKELGINDCVLKYAMECVREELRYSYACRVA